MEHTFWLDRWQKGEIGFHRDAYHASLEAHWPNLHLPPNSDVFVPLCGKSLDMQWLAMRGHRIIGAELSELAVDAFFESQKLAPETHQEGKFTVKKAGPYELWCGDIFELPKSTLNNTAAVYDRASLVAFDPDTQLRYREWIKNNLSGVPILVVSLDFDQSEMSGPPFSIPEAQLRKLFADDFTIERLSRTDALALNDPLRKRGLTYLVETVHVLRNTT